MQSETEFLLLLSMISPDEYAAVLRELLQVVTEFTPFVDVVLPTR